MRTLDENTQTILVLDQARELIRDPNRWLKGEYANGQGSYCAVGAIERIADGEATLDEKSCAALASVVASVSDPYGSIPCFNDETRTTHADVMAAFDLAIESLRDG